LLPLTFASEYVFASGRHIARRDVSTGNVYYLFADMLGSSNVVATSAGALENEGQFYPYGGERAFTQNLTNQKHKFEGKERDPESASTAQPQGLDYFGARFDSSATGRFMSPDWANKPEPVPYAKLGNPQTLGKEPSCRVEQKSSKIVHQGRPYYSSIQLIHRVHNPLWTILPPSSAVESSA
jgi:hypothetical protein